MKTAADERTETTICRMCHGGCGVVATIRDERVTSICGDRANPNNAGFLCAKGRASIDHLYHPDRLEYPLLRTGSKGSGEFARISWNEAYQRIAERLAALRNDHRPEAVVFAQGTDRNYQEWLFRFANVYGSPNVLGPAHICFYPRLMAGILSMGAFTFCDYEGTPECLIMWGSNKSQTHGDGVIGTRLLTALKRGTQLVVIDPRRTDLARKAKCWLQVRPGTDAALGLGLVREIIATRKYDTEFVSQYSSGFDELSAHVEPYTLQHVSELTTVPVSLLREVAQVYAGASSAAIELGTGVEQNKNSFHVARLAHILSALCGNIDRPGGNVIWDPTGIVGRRTFPLSNLLPHEVASKRLGSSKYKVLGMSGWAHPDAVCDGILDHHPYPVEMMLVFGSNLLVNSADSDRMHQALSALDYLVVAELFMTPTAAMADIVLPASGWMERDQLVEHAHYIAPRRALAQRGECKSDEQILMDLALRLGLDEHFWKSNSEALDHKLAPIGSSWDKFTERGYVANKLEYFKYRTKGFETRDRKFNFCSRGLERMGFSPLPLYVESKESRAEGEYLLTSAHSPFYFNSEFRNIEVLRHSEPDPVVELHPASAQREGIADGEWASVSVGEKSARFRARLTDRLAPEVVSVSANWWYPEMPHHDSWRRSNVNRLTRNVDNNEEMGSSNLRGIVCKVRRLADRTEEESRGIDPSYCGAGSPIASVEPS